MPDESPKKSSLALILAVGVIVLGAGVGAYFLAGWWGEKDVASGDATPATTPQREPGEVRLINGSAVRFLAVRAPDQQQAWDLAGAPTQWPDETQPDAATREPAPSTDEAVYEVAVRISGVDEPEAVTWFNTAEPVGDAEGPVHVVRLAVPPDATSMRVRVGTPRPTWRGHEIYGFVPEPPPDEASEETATQPTTQSAGVDDGAGLHIWGQASINNPLLGAPVAVQSVEQTPQGLVVQFEIGQTPRQIRALAMLKAQGEQKPTEIAAEPFDPAAFPVEPRVEEGEAIRTPAEEGRATYRAFFPGVNRADVETITLQSRAYEEVVFYAIPVAPADDGSDVGGWAMAAYPGGLKTRARSGAGTPAAAGIETE